jgi:hypothetical protein
MGRTAHRAALAAALVLLAGCGGGGDGDVSVAQVAGATAPEAVSGPSPAPDVGAGQEPFTVLGGEVTVAPTVSAAPVPAGPVYADEPQCPAPPPGVARDDAESPGLSAAVDEIIRTYEGADDGSGRHWTGVVVCVPGDFFTVFRVPGGRAFDRAVREVARRHTVGVHLRDTKYSLAALERTRGEVDSRRGALAAGGYLEVGVRGDKAAARRVLADLGDKVRVVTGAVTASGTHRLSAEEARGPDDASTGYGIAPPSLEPTREPENPGLAVTRLLPPSG